MCNHCDTKTTAAEGQNDGTSEAKPSWFAARGIPSFSMWGKREIEIIAWAYVNAMAHNGDEWKPVTVDDCIAALTEGESSHRMAFDFLAGVREGHYDKWWKKITNQLVSADKAFDVGGLAWNRPAFLRDNAGAAGLKIDSVSYKCLAEYAGLERNNDRIRTMTADETSRFFVLTTASMARNGAELTIEQTALLDESPFLQTIMARLEWAGLDRWDEAVSAEAMIMIASLDESNNFGTAVMWAYTLLYMAAEEREPITIDLLAQHFPYGFPVREAIEEAWVKQKGDTMGIPQCDNWLDRRSSWTPLVRILKGSVKFLEPSEEEHPPLV